MQYQRVNTKETPFSDKYGDCYYSRSGGLEESSHVYLDGNRLHQRWSKEKSFSIGELGFGTGLNFLQTANLWKATGEGFLNYVSIDESLIHPSDLKELYKQWPGLAAVATSFLKCYPPAMPGFHPILFPELRIRLILVLGKVCESLLELRGKFDAWYLDGFSPQKNPEMWSQEVFRRIKALSASEATVATYSVAADVRHRLQSVGFSVQKCPGFGQKREMLCGSLVKGREKTPSKSIAVIGAGLAGAAVAYSLSLRGVRASVYEKERAPAAGASGNTRAIVMPHVSLGPEARSEFSQKGFLLSKQLLESFGGWSPSGSVKLPTSKRLQRILNEKKNDPLFEILSSTDLSDVAGVKLNSSGLFYPLAGHANPREFTNSLIQYAKLFCDCEVRDLSELATEDFGVVVVCNGYEAKDFVSWLPLEPVRGQVCEVRSTEALERLNTVLCYDGYVTPSYGGKNFLGATYEHDTDCKAVRESDNQEILRRLAIRVPGSVEILSSRVGFRTSVIDKLPIVGPSITQDNFFKHFDEPYLRKSFSDIPEMLFDKRLLLSTAHASQGMSTCVLAAEYLVSTIMDEPMPIAASLAEALSPSRFLLRDLRRGIFINDA